MAGFPKHVWGQLKSVTADELIRALGRDGWILDGTKGSIHTYIKTNGATRRVAIHFHPQKTFGPNLLKGLLDDIGWTESDLRRLKLIR